MQATFKVHRYDPEAGGKPTSQPYTLDLPEDATVLDGLFKIREELDGTLAFRASCNRGFCGECTLRINRGGRLACMTRVATAKNKDGEITVEPTRFVRVLRTSSTTWTGSSGRRSRRWNRGSSRTAASSRNTSTSFPTNNFGPSGTR